MMIKRFGKACFIALSLICALASAVRAHGGHDDRIKVMRNGSGLAVDLQLSERDLLPFDLNHDGRLTSAEFLAQQSNVKAWIDSQLTLRRASGESLQPELFDTPVAVGDLSDADASVEYLRVIQTYSVSEEEAFALSLDFFHAGQKQIVVMRDGGIQKKIMNARQLRLWID